MSEIPGALHAQGEQKPGGNPAVDDEVERLAKVIADGWDDYVCAERISEVPEAWIDGRIYKDGHMARARAVLADLGERYILVPREGAETDEEWGSRYDLAPMTAPPGRRAGEIAEFGDEYEARAYVWHMAPPWQCKVVRRVVVRGPWEPAP